MATKGIVMIAGGHWKYGEMASILAMGIKLYSSIPIALFIDGRGGTHLTEFQKGLFTIHELPEFMYNHNKVESFYRVKTFLPELSPFDETVFLDVDMIWSPGRKAEDLFLDCNFSMINEGYIDFKTLENTISKNYHFWSQPHDIKDAYEIKDSKLYQYRSEYIYFKKCKEVEKYFSLVRKIYDNPQMKSLKFGEVLPDEIAFDIASAQMKFYPHKDNWSPTYWHYLYSFLRLEPKDIYEKYFAYSMGGKIVTQVQRDFYNALYKFYYSQYGLQFDAVMKWEDKINFAKHHQTVLK